MAFNKILVVVAGFTLALLLLANSTEALQVCATKSRLFHGPCESNKNCANECVSEEGQSYTGGYCSKGKHREGLHFGWGGHHICKCTKPCSDGPSTPPGGGGDDPPGGDDPAPPETRPAQAMAGRKGMIR